MTTQTELNSEEYLKKLQEAADEIAHERNERKTTIYHLHGDKFTCGHVGNKIGSLILEEARARVNKKYKLKLEE
jgi:hypothetical protein